jgi:RHS repeat-associated protein
MCARIPDAVFEVLRKREVVHYPRFRANEPGNERARYQWPSRDATPETDLTCSRARHYDPTVGRWLSTDPLGFDAGDENLYAYPVVQSADSAGSVE